MAERLIVKNFGPIKEVDLDLRQTTIFIGEQASGKSTLAKLIGLFRHRNMFATYSSENELWNEFVTEADNIGLLNYFNVISYLEYSSIDLHIVIQNTNIQVLKNDFFGNQINLKKLLQNDFPNLEDSTITHKEFLSEILKKLAANPNIGKEYIDALQNSAFYYYIPAERILIPTISQSLFSLISTKTNLPSVLTSFGSFYEVARAFNSNYNIDFLGIQFIHNDKGDFIKDNNVLLELQRSSTGLQSLIPMLLVLTYGDRNDDSDIHFIIEEPELNLYPTTQHDVMKFIISKCTNENQQLTITTHSPYVLSTLNVLLMAHQAGQHDKEEVTKIIPEESWVNPEEINVYFLEKSGIARQIFDREIGMISENELDNVSMVISDEFDELMDIYRSVPA